MLSMQIAPEWAQDKIAIDMVPHGSAAEVLHFSLIDQLQVSALYGAPPHFSASVEIARSGTVSIGVVVPPLIDKGRPFVIAAGNGSVSFGSVSISVELDKDSQGLGSSGLFEAQSLISLSTASHAAPVSWQTITAPANVPLYSAGVIFSKSTHTL